MRNVNIALECFGIIISALLISFCFLEKKNLKKQNRFFIAMLMVNISVLLCDALTWVFSGFAKYTVLLYLLNFFVYSLGYVMTAIFTAYLTSNISQKIKLNKYYFPIILVLCIIAILLVFVSLFNNMYFTFNDGVYDKKGLYWLSQAYPVAIMAVNMGVVFFHRKKIGLHDTVAFLSYGILPIIAMIIQISIFGITLLYIATTLSLMIIFLMIHVEQNKKITLQEIEIERANISIMLSQIQPHFLYNSLTAIMNLCNETPKLAQQAIADFADYLRGNLDSLGGNKLIPFAKELSHTKIYLKLEKIRFKNRLNIVYDIKTENFLIPPLTMQPLVENAVKHGICKKKGGGTITIQTKETPSDYCILVIDDGVGFDDKKEFSNDRTHVGIKNSSARVKTMIGGNISVTSSLGFGTVAKILIPKEKKSESFID